MNPITAAMISRELVRLESRRTFSDDFTAPTWKQITYDDTPGDGEPEIGFEFQMNSGKTIIVGPTSKENYMLSFDDFSKLFCAPAVRQAYGRPSFEEMIVKLQGDLEKIKSLLLLEKMS
jgi:hypothetical protein